MKEMPQYPYLGRCGVQGTLRYRRAIPPDLRQVLGKREVLKSFKTSRLDAALPAYLSFAAQIEADFRAARKRIGQPQIITATANRACPCQPQVQSEGTTFSGDEFVHHLTQRVKDEELLFRLETTRVAKGLPNPSMIRILVDLPAEPEALRRSADYRHIKNDQEWRIALLSIAYRFRLERRKEALKAKLVTCDFDQETYNVIDCCPKCEQTCQVRLIKAELDAVEQILMQWPATIKVRTQRQSG